LSHLNHPLSQNDRLGKGV